MEINDKDTPRPSGEAEFVGQRPITLEELKVMTVDRISHPYSDAITGIAESHSRSLGGGISAKLMQAMALQMTSDLHAARGDLKDSIDKCDSLRDSNALLEKNVAVLNERLQSTSRTKHIKNFAIFSGTTLLGSAIEFQKNGHAGYALISALFGLVLILLGWFTVPKGGE